MWPPPLHKMERGGGHIHKIKKEKENVNQDALHQIFIIFFSHPMAAWPNPPIALLFRVYAALALNSFPFFKS